MPRLSSIPLYEILVIAALTGVIVVCWLGWQVIGPNDGPQEYRYKDFKVIGNKLYNDGRHIGDWIPPQDGEPGYWKSVTFHAEQTPAE